MLFDLRASGRRRTVKTIYLLLAVLMGGGLVLFGIGGATNGGLLDAFGGGGGGGGGDVFEKKVENAQKAVKARPQDEQAWLALARARYQLAATGSDDQTAELRQAASAWERYLSMNPSKPDPGMAALMAQTYSQAPLNNPAKAVAAQEIVVDAQAPSSGGYAKLAVLAYAAGQTRKGDLSSQKALSLEKDATRRKEFKQAFKQAKTQAAAGTVTTPASG
jgi:tetratricopeptide (TPR) repeat protein